MAEKYKSKFTGYQIDAMLDKAAKLSRERVKVGTVTTAPSGSQATVETVYNENDTILNFTIPKGDSPQRGVDYWTGADKAEIDAAIENANSSAAYAQGSAEAAANEAYNASDAAGTANDAASTAIAAASAANAKAAELQAKADAGDFDGSDGTSVTVSSVEESSEDGGSNVVTFSDGNTLTVKNGAKGDIGNTLFAAFSVDDTGNLIVTTTDGYAGPDFAINDNGELEVIING